MTSTTTIVRSFFRRLFRKRASVRTPFLSRSGRSEIAVRIDDVCKRFKIYPQAGLGVLKEILFPWWRDRYCFEFTAVENVTLEIQRGEVVGVIGANGAGKSTLLKMVAGLLPIDEGSIDINGKVTAVMTMGVGVHPEFTGRENILYGAMLLGLSKREVLARTPQIIAFAELGEYIDRPLRTYSSGMAARLLFSIAMTVDPDILIVDEALATGDQRFVLKCINRIHDFCRSGATIFFVSHDMSLVQNFCHRVVLMDQGRVTFVGDPAEAVERYQGWTREDRSGAPQVRRLQLLGGTGQVAIRDFRLLGDAGEEAREFVSGGALRVEFDYLLNDPEIRRAHVSIGFLRAADQIQIGEISTRHFETLETPAPRMIEMEPAGRIRVHVEPLLLVSNHFSVFVRIFDQSKSFCEYRSTRPIFVRESGAISDQHTLFKHPGCFIHQSAPRRES